MRLGLGLIPTLNPRSAWSLYVFFMYLLTPMYVPYIATHAYMCSIYSYGICTEPICVPYISPNAYACCMNSYGRVRG